jgi:L-ascorbate metabolism protein UlaG (beta-lactamase superfamily)
LKKNISILGYLILIVVIGGLLVVGFPILKNKLFYSGFFVPKEIFTLNDKINSVPPEDAFEKRVEVFKQIDNLAKKSVSGNGFSSNIYSLVKIRLDQTLAEIPQTQVPKGKVKVWYIYNMGIIAKSSDITIAFDLAGTYAYSNMADFAKYIDILIISHFDGDHFDLSVVKEALKNGAVVIIPGDKMSLRGQFGRDPNGENAVDLIKKRNGINSNNLISLTPQEKTAIKGVEITAYPGMHIHDPEGGDLYVNPPLNAYYVDLGGFKIVHTGDAESINSQVDFTGKNIDLYVFRSSALDPRTNDTLMKLVPNAKTIFPLHILELGHGSAAVDKNSQSFMTYQSILENYANGYYKTQSEKTKFMPMIWGESLLF